MTARNVTLGDLAGMNRTMSSPFDGDEVPESIMKVVDEDEAEASPLESIAHEDREFFTQYWNLLLDPTPTRDHLLEIKQADLTSKHRAIEEQLKQQKEDYQSIEIKLNKIRDFLSVVRKEKNRLQAIRREIKAQAKAREKLKKEARKSALTGFRYRASRPTKREVSSPASDDKYYVLSESVLKEVLSLLESAKLLQQ